MVKHRDTYNAESLYSAMFECRRAGSLYNTVTIISSRFPRNRMRADTADTERKESSIILRKAIRKLVPRILSLLTGELLEKVLPYRHERKYHVQAFAGRNDNAGQNDVKR